MMYIKDGGDSCRNPGEGHGGGDGGGGGDVGGGETHAIEINSIATMYRKMIQRITYDSPK